jgi:hypothetical protein
LSTTSETEEYKAMAHEPDTESSSNDNEAPTRLTNLVAVTIEDFLLYAEDVEDGEEPFLEAPALIELAAVAMSMVVLECEILPKDVFDMTMGRAATILNEAVERWEARNRPHLSIVRGRDSRPGVQLLRRPITEIS